MKIHPTIASIRRKIDTLFDGTVVGAQKQLIISESLSHVPSTQTIRIMEQLTPELKAEFSMDVGDSYNEDFMVVGDSAE